MKFSNCGSNSDYRFVRLPTFDAFEDVEDGAEAIDATPKFVRWRNKHIPLTLSDSTTIETDDRRNLSLSAYYLVVDLRKCTPMQRKSRNAYARKILQRVVNAKREAPHPQFIGNEHLYKEGKAYEDDEMWEFYEKYDLQPSLSAYITATKSPFISIAGGISPEAKPLLAEMEKYDKEELTMPEELPWPADAWKDGEHPPTGDREYKILAQLQALMGAKAVSTDEVQAMITVLEDML